MTAVDADPESVDRDDMSTVTGSMSKSGDPISPSAGEADGSGRTIRWTTAGVALLIVAICLVVAFFQFFRAQFLFAITEPADWGHTLIIPLISGWFIWLRRDEFLNQPLRPSWSGLAIVLIGVFWYGLCAFGPKPLIHHLTRALGVWITVVGLVITVLGWRTLILAAFPLFYMFAFGVTISERIMHHVTYRLQDWSAQGAYVFMRVVGIDTDLSGNTLTVYNSAGVAHPLNVAEACSGMRMLVAFLALGTAMAYLGLPRMWQRVIVVLLGIPIAIFVNVLRVTSLGLLSLIDPGYADGDFHHFIGLIWLFPAFLLFLLLIWVVRNAVIEDDSTALATEPQSTPPLRFAVGPRTQFATAVGALLVSAGGLAFAINQLNVFLQKDPVPLRAPLGTIPTTLGDWERVRETPPLSTAMLEELGTDEYVDRDYRSSEADVRLNVHIAYYTGTIDDIPHIPRRCWGAAGLDEVGNGRILTFEVDRSEWTTETSPRNADGTPYPSVDYVHPITGVRTPLHLPLGEYALDVGIFQDPTRPRERTVGGWFFIANGQLAPTDVGVKALAFDIRNRYAYYCKVQFSKVFQSTDEEAILAEYQASVSDLLDDLLPELMRCLPDWPAYEAGATLADGDTPYPRADEERIAAE